jgi:hypothetical protein
VERAKWERVEPDRAKWERVEPERAKWERVEPERAKWERVEPDRAKWERVEPERAKWERVEPSVGRCQVRDVEKLDQFIKGSNVSFDVETAIKVRHLSSPRTRTVLYGGQTL